MSDVPATRSPLWLIAIVAIVLVADAALYRNVFAVVGPVGGTIFMVAGSFFVIWCMWWMERRDR